MTHLKTRSGDYGKFHFPVRGAPRARLIHERGCPAPPLHGGVRDLSHDSGGGRGRAQKRAWHRALVQGSDPHSLGRASSQLATRPRTPHWIRHHEFSCSLGLLLLPMTCRRSQEREIPQKGPSWKQKVTTAISSAVANSSMTLVVWVVSWRVGFLDRGISQTSCVASPRRAMTCTAASLPTFRHRATSSRAQSGVACRFFLLMKNLPRS